MVSRNMGTRLKNLYETDKKWEEAYHPQVLGILNQLIPHLAVISIASDEEDKKSATDFKVVLMGGTIAVRLRRHTCKFRDLTIRSRRDSGRKTELAKIKEGYAYRYFYGWLNRNNVLSEWILVDLDKVREKGLLDIPRKEHPNYDGTYFIDIKIKELSDAGCLIASHFENNMDEKVISA
jgi:hypothetical protein